MQAKKVEFEEREYGKNPLTERELRDIVTEGPVERFLNTRTPLYRRRNMKINRPTTEEAIRLILTDQNFLKRPVVVKGEKRIAGFKEAEFEGLL